MAEPMNEPLDQKLVPARPTLAYFLSTRTCSDAVVARIAARLASYGVQVVTEQTLTPAMRATMQKHVAAMSSAAQAALQDSSGSAMAKSPPRACFTCLKSLPPAPEPRASGDAEADPVLHCTKCNAIYFCSGACHAKAAPNHAQQQCAAFGLQMGHREKWKIDQFPFTWSNEKQLLHAYNQVNFLTQRGIHNMGLWRRLCGCFQNRKWGELSAELRGTWGELSGADEAAKAQARFETLHLNAALFPLDKALAKAPDAIHTWQDYYEAVGLPLDDPAALLLEVPLTLWWILRQHILPLVGSQLAARPNKRLVVHLAGAEKEADLLPLFDVLLALLPGIQLCIHMVNPEMSANLTPAQAMYTSKSSVHGGSLTITLHRGVYGPEHASGEAFMTKGPADVVVIMNAALYASPAWPPTLGVLYQQRSRGTRVVCTEPMEMNVAITLEGIRKLGVSGISLETRLNPFRQPVYQWKNNVGMPSYSNGFIWGL
ncbi:hypothetical protein CAUPRSCDRAFT_12097 [Caulochytrium protostelioides]|nr:hypothetical protein CAUPRSCDRAFT_12097 [Caulochytrium protostelioides]